MKHTYRDIVPYFGKLHFNDAKHSKIKFGDNRKDSAMK